MDNKIKHLEMIQGIINRMASNSFLLKGWSVTLVAGFFALSSKDSDHRFFFISYVPLIVFWILDTYYLQQERKYRNLYEKTRVLENDKVDFSMKITNELLTENTKYIECFLSISEIVFYFPTIILVTIIIVFI